MKLLVADDDPTSRRIIEACLTDAGYDVSIAVDGAQALEMIGRPVARVRTSARIVERQQELIASREQLRSGAMYDSLTGVLNRGAFIDLFHQEVARAERYETPLAVIMADFDDFQGLMDRHVHAAGEIVLVEAAHRLRTSLCERR